MISGLFYACCLFCPLYLIYKPPQMLIEYLQRRWPDVLFHHPTAQKTIALTIDDAPSKYTPAILNLLQTHNTTATFFVIGSQVPHSEEALADLVHQGNELANHAMYDEPSRALSDATLAEQITTVEKMIRDAYHRAGRDGPENWWFRPGSGFFSSRMRSLVQRLGYRLALGDVYPHDPQVPFAKLNVKHILSMVRPGSIIVCHDRREWTVPMLAMVLPELRRRGYRIVTLSELIEETV